MASRYLGDYGDANDVDTLLKVVNRETRNDFVAAEAAIATLKLLAKKADAPLPPPVRKPVASRDAGKGDRYTVASDDVVEMEPLVIRPPRLNIPESVRVAQSLNNRLIQLIQNKLDQPVDKDLENDPNLRDLNQMVTPEGFALQTRYSQLSVAVSEGLAGTTDPLLRAELTHLVQSSRGALTQATALLSLSYARDARDIPLVTQALISDDTQVRFGALEAAEAGHFKDVVPDLINMAANDPVPVFRVYAIQVLLEFGEPSAHDLLISHDTDDDWPSRAMGYWLLGRYGDTADHGFVSNHFASEQNAFVLAELALAAQRLAP
jgi:HEAT repeat protein